MTVYGMIETRDVRYRTSLGIETNELTENDIMEAWPDEEFKVKVKYLGEDAHLALVVDSGSDILTGDERIYGDAFIQLSILCKAGELELWYPISKDGNYIGDVKLKTNWKEGNAELEEMEEDPDEAPEMQFFNGRKPNLKIDLSNYWEKQHPYAIPRMTTDGKPETYLLEDAE